jgi:hypothetical protein
MQPINAGDRVMYSARFLRTAGIYTGEIPFMRGTVKELKTIGKHQFATVQWDGSDDEDLRTLRTENLTRADSLHTELP